jgi:hypothetical protein
MDKVKNEESSNAVLNSGFHISIKEDLYEGLLFDCEYCSCKLMLMSSDKNVCHLLSLM